MTDASGRGSRIHDRLRFWDGSGSVMFSNAGSIFATTVLTAGLGTLYWIVAARSLSPEAVGLGAAAISAMSLLGRMGTLGLGTMLMGELGRHQGREAALISPSVLIATAVGAASGLAFALAAGLITPELEQLAQPGILVIFVAGVGLTAASLVLDQALVGLLRGWLQVTRNVTASLVKLLALIGCAIFLVSRDGTLILITWSLGTAVSLGLLATMSQRRSFPFTRLPPGLSRLALRHHGLNLAIIAPGLLLPILVTALLSVEANGFFYIGYTLAGIAHAIPSSIAIALFATVAREPDALSQRVRSALVICLLTAIVATGAAFLLAGPALGLIGQTYAEQTVDILKIMTLASFPITIVSMYNPIARLDDSIGRATALLLVAAVLQLIGASIGAVSGGLTGLATGWVVGLTLGVIPLVPAVYRVALGSRRVA